MAPLPPLPRQPGEDPRARLVRTECADRAELATDLRILGGGFMAIAVMLLALLLLPGCLTAPIDRAGDRADQAVTLAAAQARQIAQDTTAALDARMAARLDDVAAKADAARAAALADVDARMQRTRGEIVADVKAIMADADARVERVLANADARLERHSAEWGKRADAALAESAAWRAEIRPVLSAVGGATNGGQKFPGSVPPGSSDEGSPLTNYLITGASSTLAALIIRHLDHRRKAAREGKAAG